ncbi:glycosyltransferase family 4 protein [Labilibacter marinus]|uniref:glycosyltransferase family 4 protein n=1 Tax=Labilibacter marinus TaxID=1477105 RepID=UPI000831FC7B|nr:glycosyltransferase family 4 protein [Labilibacter marinus]
MPRNNPKVLIVATSRKTRGGITSVVKAHEQGKQWKKYHCKWIETHRDGNALRKIAYFIFSLSQYMCLLPNYDLVHIHIATTGSAKRKQVFYYLAKWMNKKVIFHFHPSNEKFLFESANQKLYRKLFSSTDLVLVLSKQWQVWIKAALGLYKNIEVLYNPCPIVDRIDTNRKNNILFAGTLIERKGYGVLLRAFASIADKYPSWKIVFAGNGEIEMAKLLADKLGIRNQIELLGWVSGNEKERQFQSASIYCLASDGEGFPMGVLDAWAYGIPCIVTPVGGIPDIVIDGKNGLLFPVGDINILSQQIEELIDNKCLREQMVIESDKYVNGEFNQDIINNKLDKIYSKVLNKC